MRPPDRAAAFSPATQPQPHTSGGLPQGGGRASRSEVSCTSGSEVDGPGARMRPFRTQRADGQPGSATFGAPLGRGGCKGLGEGLGVKDQDSILFCRMQFVRDVQDVDMLDTPPHGSLSLEESSQRSTLECPETGPRDGGDAGAPSWLETACSVGGNMPVPEFDDPQVHCADLGFGELERSQDGDYGHAQWQHGAQYPLLGDRLFFTTHPSEEFTIAAIKKQRKTFFFSSHIPGCYQPMCCDFGPTNVSLVVRFCRELREKFNHPKLQSRPLVYYCDSCPEEITNTAMNLAAYLMLEHGMTPEQAVRPFTSLSPSPLRGFRDATWCKPTYHLDLLACLRGLQRAVGLCYLSASPERLIDDFNTDLWDQLDDPSVLNMNQVTPKFIAFVGPVDKPFETMNECEHSPEEFVPEFRQRQVTAVVRLNEACTYDSRAFTEAGFVHYDVQFDDCTVPDLDVVERFLDICDRTSGVVAVHCLAGLGRTGTLIAIWMMKHDGFSAREAMGYLRLARPGSVIGPQQHFLDMVERASWRGNRMVPHTMDEELVSAGARAWCSASISLMMAEQVKSAVLTHGRNSCMES